MWVYLAKLWGSLSNISQAVVIQTPCFVETGQTDGEDGTTFIRHHGPKYSSQLPLQSEFPSPTPHIEAQPRARANDLARQPKGYLRWIQWITSQVQAFFSGVSGMIHGYLTTWKVDEIKYKYTKSALLFTGSILITWIPPSANRVYSAVHPNRPWSYPLNVASAIILPSQGLCNTLIFFLTSVPICKRVWRDIREGRRLKVVGKMFGWMPVVVNLPLTDRSVLNL